MKRKIHIVPHTHWDREWYFNTSRSKVYLMKDLSDILDTLEKDDDFKHFILDAQGSLLDDYINWKPEDKDRVKKLVKSKKLIIGPWYTQTDQMVISAESIVRNMYYGMKCCEEYGEYMNVAYVPDSFGQAGNMPQIYQSFGIEDTLFWRGVSDDMVKYTDFMWKGDDGSKVYVTQIPFGYYIGGPIPEDIGSEEFWKIALDTAGKRSLTNNVYFPNGFDQAPIRKNLPKIVKDRNEKDSENEYIISNIENYMKEMKKEAKEFEEISSELLIAKHMRIHKSIFSSRSDLKILNTKIQNYITNILEPILTLSYQLGNYYPHKTVEEIWKLMFENAAHDSIGSCISDNANEDVYVRYKRAKDIALNLVELHSRLIATKIKNKKDVTITLFNTLPYERTDIVVFDAYLPSDKFSIKDDNNKNIKYTILEKEDLTEYILKQTIRLNPSKDIFIPRKVYKAKIAIEAKNISSMGYIQYYFDLDECSENTLEDINYLENEYYRISINEKGSLDIYDKVANYEYKNQAVIVENGDDGDSFNYSPPREDMEIMSTNSKFNYKIDGSEIYQKISINYEMKIPKDLNERKERKTSIFLPVTLNVILRKHSRIIDFEVKVDNKGLSHRVCVLFDSKLVTKFNFADQQYGIIKRPNVYEKELELYFEKVKLGDSIKNPTNFDNDQVKWQEMPISIETMQNYVSINDEKRGIAVIPQGVREYEIIGESGNQIRLTLFRTYGFMGKENLIYRPGRASGETIIETKEAQLQKEICTSFGFMTYKGNINDSNIDILSKEHNTPIQTYEYADFLNGRLIFVLEDVEKENNTNYSIFKSTGNLVVSTIKKSEEKEGIIIRLYNGKYDKILGEKLQFNKNIKRAYYTNLKEEFVEEIKICNNVINIKEIGHCKFVTIYVE